LTHDSRRLTPTGRGGRADATLWSTEARADRNNMAPRDALKFWASAGIRMPWIEPLTWAYVALAVFVYLFLWVAPERAAVVSADWVAFVIVRNLAIYLIFYGGAHHFLYETAAAKELAAQDRKYNPLMPGHQGKRGEIPGGWAPLGTTLKLILTRRGAELSRIAQHSHDRFWCLTSSVISSLMEVYFIHAWAAGTLPVLEDSEVFGLGSVAHLLVAPFWRTVHFYAVHRLIHSRFLYKNVHYLHHRSRNPAPWSGLSMHPIESFGKPRPA
jgi:lathosterol oxidase